VTDPYPCTSNPCIDQTAFGPTIAGSYHCAEIQTINDDPTGATQVDFEFGYVTANAKFGPLNARAVRAGL
jgi:hypothetical protein